MKIGEFAKKHQVTVDTVRHYINEGLLTPLRENTQYNFSEIDDGVMDTILLLKSMNFRLDEMKAYLLVQTMFTSSTYSYLGSFKTDFEKKLLENQKEIEKLLRVNKIIEDKLSEYNKGFSFKRGIALGLLQSLQCSECGNLLELEKPELSHNEILGGELVCPKCGKRYFIRYGILSDKPIDDMEDRTEGISEMAENYLKKNDEAYTLTVREFFQKVAEVTADGCKDAHNIMIVGDACGFINSAFLRSLPENARLFAILDENMSIKLMEDLLPKETVIYVGKIENFPLKEEMDYIFYQNYDVDIMNKKLVQIYPNLAKGAIVDSFKTIFHVADPPSPDEKKFLDDMKNLGFQKHSAYKTKNILLTKESNDWSILENKTDIEIQYGIYTFKTLG